jgi:hypothetical protein
MFQLTSEEYEALRFQIETLENQNPLRLQNETLKKGRGQHSKYLPYAFTEQGVAMLSGVLNSDKAINMNIAIMRAFVEIRRILFRQSDLKEQHKNGNRACTLRAGRGVIECSPLHFWGSEIHPALSNIVHRWRQLPV